MELTTTNLAILTAAALIKGHTPKDSFHIPKNVYHDIEQLAREYTGVDHGQSALSRMLKMEPGRLIEPFAATASGPL